MDANNQFVQKKIIHAGTDVKPFVLGSKVNFHFVTRKLDEDKTLIDDSRAMGKTMELILGKKFKLEVWELIVKSMAINEVSQYKVDKCLVAAYPFVSKTLREAFKPPENRNHHCCGVTLQNEGIGFDDLNTLLKDPCDLEFTIELLSVESPEEYTKEVWQMSEGEKLAKVPQLREEGNQLFKSRDYKQAMEKYSEALAILEQLMLKEKPGEEEWKSLEQQKLPLLLNYSQCKLYEGEFYCVIEHCTTVLKSEPNNIKALYRRGLAHVGAWNPSEARGDLNRTAELDPTLKSAVDATLRKLDEEERKRNAEDKAKLAGKLF